MSPADVPDASPEITPLDSAIRDYLMRLDAGEVVSSAELLAAHPELRDDLKAFLDVAAIVQRLAGTQSALDDTATEYKTVNEPLATPTNSQAGTNRIEAAAELTGPFPMLLGQYRVLRHIGQGAMGAVYVADDVRLGRKVALKVPLGSVVAQSEALDRFMREAQASAKLRHHNICPIYEVNELNGIYYIAMAFIEGKPLSELMNQKRRFSGKQIAVTIRKIAQALEVAHRAGIVHRDLKPANIMIDQDGEPIVMDFGLARQMNSADQVQLTQEGMILGTPAYMSPEQVRSELNRIGPASDVYSLGVMLYELLCSRHPFSGPLMTVLMDVANEHKKPPKPSEIRPNCDPQLEAICLRMVSKPIGERYSSMKEVAAALSGYLKTGQTMPEIPVTKVTTPASSEAVPDIAAAVTPLQVDVPVTKPDQQSPVPALETQSAGGNRATSRRRMLAFGSLGALVLAGVIIITITNRDGSQSKLTVPDTSKVEISHKADAPTPQSSSQQKSHETPNEVAEARWYGWPSNAPKAAIAPFNTDQAKKYQKDWAEYLNVPVEYTNSIGMKFRLIPPGEFLMGSTQDEVDSALKQVDLDNPNGWDKVVMTETPKHKVTLTQPLYVGTNEVRQMDYERVIANKQSPDSIAVNSYPASGISFLDAANFCIKLGELENLEPFNFIDSHLHGTGYRLLTEAEWEYACRAGTVTRYWDGDTEESLAKTSWIASNCGGRVHEVGTRTPNPFGLSDTLGNVWEWVLDSWNHEFDNNYAPDPTINPFRSLEDSPLRTIRGGSFSKVEYQCRSSTRTGQPAVDRPFDFGFRVALTIDAVRNELKRVGPTIPSPPSIRPKDTVDYTSERLAVKQVLAAGGTVFLKSGVRVSKLDMLPLIPSTVLEVRLNGESVTDELLATLQAFRHLEVLDVNHSAVTEKGLAARLSSWPRLTVLKVTGSSMVGPLLDLSGCPGLREFHCPPNITNERLVHVVQTCPLLKTINLRGTSGLNLHVLTQLRYLANLTCAGDRLTVENVKALTAISSLQRLTCIAPINDEVASRIGSFGSQLQTLEISALRDDKSGLTDTGFAELGKALRPIELSIRGMHGSPSKIGLLALAAMRDLRTLSIQTDDADQKLSPADVAEFHRLRPSIQLTVGTITSPGLLTWPEGVDGGIASWQLPDGAPKPAISPFSPEEAKEAQTAWANYLQRDREIKNSIGIEFQLIPPGEFEYLNPERGQNWLKSFGPQPSLARITEPYYLSNCELTIEQFSQFVNETKYKTEAECNQGGRYRSLITKSGSRHELELSWKRPGPWISEPKDPVSQVTYNDAVAFCHWLSRKDNATYRLASEMEWYHACFAGSKASWAMTDDGQQIAQLARFQDSLTGPIQESTRPVRTAGVGVANPFGLSDMVGNVWEMVTAARGRAMPNGHQPHPLDSTDGVFCVGGGWESYSADLGSAWCGHNFSGPLCSSVGFRVLKEIKDGNRSNAQSLSNPLLLTHGRPLSNAANVSRPQSIPGVRSWSLERKQSLSVNVVAHHPFQDVLAIAGWDGMVRLWTSKGELKQILSGPSCSVNSIRFLDEGKKLLASDAFGEIWIWNLESCELLGAHDTEGMVPVALSANEKTIAGYVRDDSITLIDVATGTRQNHRAVHGCLAMAWSPDNKLLATTSSKSAIHIWQVHPWKQIAEVTLEPYLYYNQVYSNISWSPDGKTIAFIPMSGGNKAYLIDGATFQLLPGIEQTKVEFLTPVWSHDGRHLATVSWDGCAVFELASRKLRYKLPPTSALCWSPDDSQIYSATGEAFTTSTGESIQRLSWLQSRPTRNTSLAGDGRSFARTDEAGLTTVWKSETGQPLAQWTRGSIQAAPLWAPDGQYAIVVKNGNIQCINPKSGVVFRTIATHVGELRNVVFSHDSRWLATSGLNDNRLRVFDAANGHQKWESDPQQPGADRIAWSPDGKRIATSHNESGEIRVWNSENGQLQKSYNANTSSSLASHAKSLRAVQYLDWSLAGSEIFAAIQRGGCGFRLDLKTDKCDEWSWYVSMGGHAYLGRLAPNCESRLFHNGWFSGYAIDDQTPLVFLGQVGCDSSWMPDSRRVLMFDERGPSFGYDVVTRRRLGTHYPECLPNVWLCIGPTGHYRSGFIDQLGDGTDPKALSVVEDLLVYIAQAEDGSQVTFSPKEFAEKFGWKNDPAKATLLDLNVE